MCKKIIAAILAAVMLVSLAACGSQGTSNNGGSNPDGPGIPDNPIVPVVYGLEKPEYPEMVQKPKEEDFKKSDGSIDWDGYRAANDEWYYNQLQREKYLGTYESKLEHYLRLAMTTFMKDDGKNNLACSPTNIFMALAMVAECAGGETRQEILDMLGAKDIEELRETAQALWTTNYNDDGQLTTLLGSSLWMNEKIGFNQDTVAKLAAHYYASSFHGDMEDQAFFEEFKKWLDEQTGGLLKDKISQLEPFDRYDVMVIATSIYFKGSWTDEFYPELNTTDKFHAKDSDIDVEFMHSSDNGLYYPGNGFGAINLPFNGNASMWIILPDEGVSPTELFADGRAQDFILGSEKSSEMRKIVLSLPKFDVSSSMQLKDALSEMGMKLAFTDAADFTPLTTDVGVYVSSVTHDARVKIDEEGCEAAAYTVITMATTSMPMEEEELEFNVNRPFIFVIAGADGLPMFIGTVNTPVE